MGREIRRVPPNWEHPKDEKGNYRSMHEEYYETALNKWLENHHKWMNNTHPDQLSGTYSYVSKYKYFGSWESAPDPDYYNIYYKPEEATWYQLYQTVSEGTPVSPPFETKEELSQYLADHGEFGSRYEKPTLEQARNLVNDGYAPSLIMSMGKVMNPYEQQDLKSNEGENK